MWSWLMVVGFAPAAAEPAAPLTAAMHERFVLLTETRDHTVQGRLEDAQQTSRYLADVQYPRGLPSDWTKSLKTLRREARKTSKSDDLVEATAGVGRMAQVCGDCHAASGGGPGLVKADDVPPQQWSEGMNMALHKWATDWLWLGLVAGDDEAWLRGANVLDDKPLELRFADAVPPTHQPALEQLLYLLAGRATRSDKSERGELMGQFLATCAECHVTERDAAK